MKNLRLNHPHILKIHKFMFLASKSIDKILDEMLDIGFSQSMILMYIHSHPKTSQRDISSSRNITPAAVSRHVDILIQKDYIKLKENELNKREHILEISPMGEEVLFQVIGIINRELDTICHDLEKKEIEEVDKIFSKLLNSFDDKDVC